MATFTLQKLQDRVIGLTALPAVIDANTSITAAQMLDWLITSARELAGIVREYGDTFYFMERQDLTTTPGISLVSLPEDFANLHSLTLVLADDVELPLHLAAVEDLRVTEDTWDGSGPVYYRLAGNALELYPTPQAEHTIRMVYATGLAPTSLASVLVCRENWDQFIVLGVCELVRIRQKEDGSDFAGKKAVTEASLRRQLKRDRFGQQTVRDVRSGGVDDARRYRYRGY